MLKKVNNSHQRDSSIPQKLGGGFNNGNNRNQKSNIILPLIMNSCALEEDLSLFVNYAPPKAISVPSAYATSALEKEELFMRSNFI